YRGAADSVRAAGEGGDRDRIAGPLHRNPPVLPRPADGIHRRGAEHHRGKQPYRVAADPVPVAGAGTAADQPGTGGEGAPAVRAEYRGGAQEPRGGTGETGVGRKSDPAGPVLQVQVRVPGEYVARAAYPAELAADSGAATGRQPGRQPVVKTGGIREDHPRLG